VQHGEVLQLVAEPQLRIQPALLRHGADPLADGRVDPAAAPGDASGIRRQEPADDPHRGRLARAIATDEAEHGTERHREAQLVHRDEVPEASADSAKLKTPFHAISIDRGSSPGIRTNGQTGCGPSAA